MPRPLQTVPPLNINIILEKKQQLHTPNHIYQTQYANSFLAPFKQNKMSLPKNSLN